MARLIKLTKLFLHVAFILFLNYFIINNQNKIFKVKKINRFTPDLKHVLIWSTLQDFESGQRAFIRRKCRNINCYLTRNRSLFDDLRYFDAVVFNLQDVSKNKQGLPDARAPHQKYVFAANNSADNYPVCNSVYENFFNWTWTYRTNSAIRYKFFAFTSINQENIQINEWPDRLDQITSMFKDQLNTKSKGVVTFLDKCQSRSKREQFLESFVKELSIFNISIDVFGKCGADCSSRRNSLKSCLSKVKRDYFFYLAMEDSFSEDYVTDSVLYGLQYNAVPIVFGEADYDKFLPPNSYINALELGEEKLAKTINEILQSKKKHMYYEFFSWRNHYIVKETEILDPCALCDALNKPEWMEYRWSHSYFRKWWNPDYKRRCSFYSKYLAL